MNNTGGMNVAEVEREGIPEEGKIQQLQVAYSSDIKIW